MSIRPIRQLSIVAFAVSLTGVAFARTPPSLQQRQQASAQATRSSGGYRDINRRFGAVAARPPVVVQTTGGYRDILYRFTRASRG